MARKELRRRLMAEHGCRCRYCRRELLPHKLTLDHVVPVSRGGGNDPDNLVLCCRACNASKDCRTPTEWAADILT